MSINKITLACFCTILLSSCSTAKQNEWFVSHNGNMPSEERVSQIQRGATKDDVLMTLGVPSSTISFDNNTWIYMSSDIKRVAFMAPKEIDRNILKISFNTNDQVETIEHLTLDDGKEISISADKTPVNGEKMGFFRRYFGGVGQYNPFAGSNNGGL